LESTVKRTTLSLLIALTLAGCHQTAFETTPPPPSKKDVQTQMDEQHCKKSSQFKGFKYLAPFFSSETDTRYADCLRRQGYTMPKED
jgi:hypothetical protein